MTSEPSNSPCDLSEVKKSHHWSRLIYMLVFALLLNLAGAVMWLLAALQFAFALTSGRDNAQLRAFGASLAAFVQQALLYVSYNSERKPFPFADWPKPEPAQAADDTSAR